MSNGIITIDDVFPEHKEVDLKLTRFSKLLLEIDKVQTYLNKFGFNIDVRVRRDNEDDDYIGDYPKSRLTVKPIESSTSS